MIDPRFFSRDKNDFIILIILINKMHKHKRDQHTIDIKNILVSEKDLDHHFLGKWNINHIDKYGTIKAGTKEHIARVRSKVDIDVGIIRLYAYISEQHGTANIIMDGTTGFYSKIIEDISCEKEDECIPINFLFIKLLTDEQIRNDYTKLHGYRIWRSTAEITDMVYNQNQEYCYPFYYIAKDTNTPKMIGMYTELPITHFNEYVTMRNLWINDYKKSTHIVTNTVVTTKSD